MRPSTLLLTFLLLAPLPTLAADPSEETIRCAAPVLAGFPCNARATFAQYGNELSIAVNPLDAENLVVGAKDYSLTGSGAPACSSQNFWGGHYTTLDGGATWTNGRVPGYPGGPNSVLTGYPCASDPVVAFDGHGRAYFSGLALVDDSSTDALYVARSTNGGVNFTEVRVADSSNFNDKNWLAVDPSNDNVYVTWTLFNSGSGIYFRRALAGDIANWSARVRLSNQSSGSAQGSFIAVGPDGTVYVTWTDAITGGSGSISFVKSTDHGATWTSERSVFSITAGYWNDGNAYRTPTMPQLAVSTCASCATRGSLYLVWQDRRNGDTDAYFSRSTDGGTTWSSARRLNDDAVSNGRPQYFPAIAVDPADGKLTVGWFDRRDDASNVLLHFYTTTSTDGGSTWTANQRVTTAGSDPQYSHHQSGAVFIGDYTGIAALGGAARPVWVDTREHRPDVLTTRANPGEVYIMGLAGGLDVASARVDEQARGSLLAPPSGEPRAIELRVPYGLDVTAPGAKIASAEDGWRVTWTLAPSTKETRVAFALVPRHAGSFALDASLRAGDASSTWTGRLRADDAGALLASKLPLDVRDALLLPGPAPRVH